VSWGSLHDFLAMGGYGGYIWSAYGVLALGVAAEIAGVRARLVRARRVTAALRGRAARPRPPAT